VIGPGSLPRWRPMIKKRTLTYTRRRRTKARPRNTAARAVSHDDIVIFDPPSELPTATLVPRSRGLALIAGLERWLLARWTWLLPRSVPVAVAALGLVLVLLSADYLGHALS
jgi:hypothetical protein